MSLRTLSSLVQGGVLEIGDGYRTKQSELAGTGFRIIRAADISGGTIVEDGKDFVSRDLARAVGSKRAEIGDVVLTTKGTVGRTAFVAALQSEAVYSPQLCYFRVLDHGVLRSKFLFYWLQSPAFTMQSSYRSASSDMAPYISLTDLRSVEIDLPEPNLQLAIAEVLGALDDKIDANRRTGRLVLELMQTNWSAWAQDFPQISLDEVVQVGLSGVWGEASPTSSSDVEVLAWRGRDIEEFVEGALGSPPKRWVTPVQLGRRVGHHANEIWTAGSGTLGPSMLISNSARNARQIPMLYSNFVKRLVPIPGMEHLLGSAWLAMLAEWKRNGFADYRTGSAIPNLDSKALLAGVKVPLLNSDLIARLDSWTDAALGSELRSESQKLAETRDTLLPQLMSGKLRVKDAERVVSDVV